MVIKMIEEFLILHNLSWTEAILRVGISLSFGFLLGYDRSSKNKTVDFRVYMIVASTTCLLSIMGQELTTIYYQSEQNIEISLMRIVQGVLTGIGFLGAGAIVKTSDGTNIVGSTTGASIWSAGSMGLMLGFGMYGLAVLGFGVLLFILIIFGLLKKPLFNEHDNENKRGTL